MKNTPHISSAFRDMATGAGMITLGLAAAFLASVAGMANHSEGMFSLKQHNPALGTRIEAEPTAVQQPFPTVRLALHAGLRCF